MLQIKVTNQFKKDLKRINQRNYNINLLDYVVSQLVNQKPLDKKYKNHSLFGSYNRILRMSY